MLELTRDCPGAWVDFNGHMRDAYYVLLVSFANDRMMDALGMGPTYLGRTGRTLYNLDNRIRYLKEARQGDRLRVAMRLIDADARRLHLHARIESGGALLAVNEAVLIHVNQRGDGRSGPRAEDFPPYIAARVAERRAADTEDPGPRAGGVGLRRKKT